MASVTATDARREFFEIIRRAGKDIATLTPKLKQKLKGILANQIAVAPYGGKKLVGGPAGSWSVRLTHRDRIVYRIDEANGVVFILRARTHYQP